MIEINLLPWREALQRQENIKKILEIIAATISAISLLLLLHFIFNTQIEAQATKLEESKQGLARANQQWEEIRQLHETLHDEKHSELDFSALFQREMKVLKFFEKIAQTLPSTLSLQEFRLQEENWDLRGSAPQLADILLFSRATGKGDNLKIQEKNHYFHYQLHAQALP